MGSDKKKGFDWDIRSISILSAGSVLSQIIIFSVTLSVARLYSPENFGSYAIVISIANLVAPILTYSKETFIVPNESNQKTFLLMRDIRRTFSLNVSILFVLSCILSTQKNSFKFLRDISSWEIFLSILLAALFAIHMIFQQIFLREERFNVIAMRGPIQNLGIGVYQITFGFIRSTFNGLVVGEALGRLTSIGIYARQIKKIIGKWKKEDQTFVDVKVTRKNLYSVNFISILLDSICISLPLIASGIFYGDYFSGQISMSLRIAALPSIVVGAAFSHYLLASGSTKYREFGEMNTTAFYSILRRLIPIALIFCIGLFIVGEWLVALILGEQWKLSGDVLKMLTPMIFVGLVWAPISSLFYVNHMWVTFLKVTALRFLLMLAAILASQYMDLPFQIMIILVYLSSSIAQVIGLYRLNLKFKS
jgi:O-antigen/teichoic acid export membrane protein